MTDDVQPQEGQGDSEGSIFAPYLESVPEEHRETVATYLKDAEKGVNTRLQEAAELKKSWGPYEPTKDLLQNYTPEDLGQLVEWHQQVTSSPESYREWLQAQFEEQGLSPQEAEDAADLQLDEGDPDVMTRLDQLLQERLGPLQEGLTRVQQERGIEVETQAISTELSRLEKDAGMELSEQQREMIVALGEPAWTNDRGEELPPGDASWVQYGFDRFKEISDMGAKLFVEQKSQQPASAITTGAVASQKPITSFDDAGKALRERWKAQQAG